MPPLDGSVAFCASHDRSASTHSALVLFCSLAMRNLGWDDAMVWSVSASSSS